MRVSLLLALLSLPAAAELKRLSIRFEPSDCAACTQSLPERLRRIRGVEAAALQPGQAPRLEVRFAPGNRVRLSRVRETIEQDGTKWIEAAVEASGLCERNGGGGLLKLFEGDSGIPVEGRFEPGPCSLSGTINAGGKLTAR